jgi:hypothetical protein
LLTQRVGESTVNFPFTIEMRDTRVFSKRTPNEMFDSSSLCGIDEILPMSYFYIITMFPEIRHPKDAVGTL